MPTAPAERCKQLLYRQRYNSSECKPRNDGYIEAPWQLERHGSRGRVDTINFDMAGSQAVNLVLEATNVSLWWPNTYGAQPRYSLAAEFVSDSTTATL